MAKEWQSKKLISHEDYLWGHKQIIAIIGRMHGRSQIPENHAKQCKRQERIWHDKQNKMQNRARAMERKAEKYPEEQVHPVLQIPWYGISARTVPCKQ